MKLIFEGYNIQIYNENNTYELVYADYDADNSVEIKMCYITKDDYKKAIRDVEHTNKVISKYSDRTTNIATYQKGKFTDEKIYYQFLTDVAEDINTPFNSYMSTFEIQTRMTIKDDMLYKFYKNNKPKLEKERKKQSVEFLTAYESALQRELSETNVIQE